MSLAFAPLVIATRAMASANVALDPTSVRCLSERREPSFVHRGMVRQSHRDSQTEKERERERERNSHLGFVLCSEFSRTVMVVDVCEDNKSLG
jgi:hypothetical protein